MQKLYAPIPKFAWLIFIVALVAIATTFAMDLGTRMPWYVDFVHVLTAFAVTLLMAFYLYGRDLIGVEFRFMPLVLIITGLGLSLCVLWETFEWGIRPFLGVPRETLAASVTDVVLGLLGVVAAALLSTRLTQ